MGVLEGEERKQAAEKTFEEIMAERKKPSKAVRQK